MNGGQPTALPWWWWLAAATGPAAVLATLWGPLADDRLEAPVALFALVLVGAGLCAVAAAVVLVHGWRRRLAEVAVLGAALWAMSVLPLAHGLLMPTVLVADNAGTAVTALLAVPVGLAAGLPVLWRSRAGTVLARRWRTWSLGWVAGSTGLAAAFVARPDLAGVPDQVVLELVVVAAAAGCLALAARQLRLFRVSRRPGFRWAALGFVHLGGSTLVWLAMAPWSAGFWVAHLCDVAGVLTVCAGLLAGARRDRGLSGVLEPVLAHDPLAALEVGLAPPVHRFVAALDEKDPSTREHVVRVAATAMRAGMRAGMKGGDLRDLGLAALLHDIGKLLTPDAILRKPGHLSPAEWRVMQDHTAQGERLLAAEPSLARVARWVRWHHERVDGTGYPDGLSGDRIPLPVGIISVCDAWDAMVSNRHYRAGMSPEAARAVLVEHAGRQWSPACVALLLDELDARPQAEPAFDRAGRSPICADAVPVGATA